MRSRLASLEPPVPCAECEQRTPGLRWGDICPDCRTRLARRAAPWARRISLLAALIVVGYAYLGMRLETRSRIWVAVIAIATYFLTREIFTRIAVDYLRGRAPRT
ncbi:MAG: hypothetical protein ACRENB_08055 [Gemmatimonadales bacterium]